MENSKFTHNKCGVVTDIGPQLAGSHRLNPKLFVNFFCGKCNQQCPVAEFEVVAGTASPEPVAETAPEVTPEPTPSPEQ